MNALTDFEQLRHTILVTPEIPANTIKDLLESLFDINKHLLRRQKYLASSNDALAIFILFSC
jgi:hypothetical protein